MATKAKRTRKNWNADKMIDRTVERIETANDFVCDTTEKFIVTGIKIGEQWQSLVQKSLNKGFKMADTQQDIMFNAIEGVGTQISAGYNRAKSMLTK